MAKGRPQGAENIQAQTISTLSRCIAPGCESTERKVLGKTEQEYEGLDDQGRRYTHIVRRRVQCSACGQVRIDRELACRAKK